MEDVALHQRRAKRREPRLRIKRDGVVLRVERDPREAVRACVGDERVQHETPDPAAAMCGQHSHSPNLVPFGVTPVKLQPLYHMTGFLGEGVPVFEIRTVAGRGTNLLITDGKLGRSLAKTLGDKPAALMRGHGSVVVGGSVQQAVYRAIYMELNARLQSEAMRLGRVNYLTQAEARE